MARLLHGIFIISPVSLVYIAFFEPSTYIYKKNNYSLHGHRDPKVEVGMTRINTKQQQQKTQCYTIRDLPVRKSRKILNLTPLGGWIKNQFFGKQ